MKKIILLFLMILFSLTCFTACLVTPQGNQNGGSSTGSGGHVTEAEFYRALSFADVNSCTINATVPNSDSATGTAEILVKVDGGLYLVEQNGVSTIYESYANKWYRYEEEEGEVKVVECNENELPDVILDIVSGLNINYKEFTYENGEFVKMLNADTKQIIQFENKEVIRICEERTVNGQKIALEIKFSNYNNTTVKLPASFFNKYYVTKEEFYSATNLSSIDNYTIKMFIDRMEEDENGSLVEKKIEVICKIANNKIYYSENDNVITYELVNGIWYCYQEVYGEIVKLEYDGDPKDNLLYMIDFDYELFTFKLGKYLPKNYSEEGEGFLQFENKKLVRVYSKHSYTEDQYEIINLEFTDYGTTVVEIPTLKPTEFKQLFVFDNVTVDILSIITIDGLTSSNISYTFKLNGERWKETTKEYDIETGTATASVRYFDGEYVYKNGELDVESQDSAVLEFMQFFSRNESSFVKNADGSYSSACLNLEGSLLEDVCITVENGRITYISAIISQTEESIVRIGFDFSNYGTTVI